jgi:heat shock protein HtpX
MDTVPAGRRRALELFGAIGLLVVVVVALIGAGLGAAASSPVAGLVIGVVVGVAVATGWLAAAWRRAEDRVLSLLGAAPSDPVRDARLYNLVDGLCAQSGLPRPSLFAVNAPGANAAVVGRDPYHGAFVVTHGLLGSLTPIELEGVVAQGLSHLQRGDSAVATGVLALGRPMARLLLPRTGSGPVTAWLDRQAHADLAAVSLTRYPPGLVSALERLRAQGSALAGMPPESAALWIAPLDGEAPDAVWEDRIETLREL